MPLPSSLAPLIDLVVAVRPHADVIVVRAQDDVGVIERGIGTAQQSDDIIAPVSHPRTRSGNTVVADRGAGPRAGTGRRYTRPRDPVRAKASRGLPEDPKTETTGCPRRESAEMRSITARCSAVGAGPAANTRAAARRATVIDCRCTLPAMPIGSAPVSPRWISADRRRNLRVR